MVLAYHVIWGVYGFWLPNDPRGSWSDFVAAWELVLAAGQATKTSDPRSLAHVDHDHAARLEAKRALKYPPVEFTGRQALAIAHGFSIAIEEGNLTCLAGSILPGHTHLVLARVERPITRVIGHLKSRASHQLRAENVHPLAAYQEGDHVPTPWAEGAWTVFLDTPEAVRRAIDYVEQNPVKEGKPAQKWSFVTPYGT